MAIGKCIFPDGVYVIFLKVYVWEGGGIGVGDLVVLLTLLNGDLEVKCLIRSNVRHRSESDFIQTRSVVIWIGGWPYSWRVEDAVKSEILLMLYRNAEGGKVIQLPAVAGHAVSGAATAGGGGQGCACDLSRVFGDDVDGRQH